MRRSGGAESGFNVCRRLCFMLMSVNVVYLQEQLLIQIETMRAENEQGRSRSNSLLHG